MASAARETRIPYLEIAADIREQIRSGRLVPGDKLRSLRSMAADYTVAQGTVGAAMEVLRAEGLIDTIQSKGSVVLAAPGEVPGDPDVAKLSAELAELREMVRDHDVMLKDLYQRVPGPHLTRRPHEVSEERGHEQLG